MTNLEVRHLAPQFDVHRVARERLPLPIKGRGSSRGQHCDHEEHNQKKEKVQNALYRLPYPCFVPTNSPDLVTLLVLKTRELHTAKPIARPTHMKKTQFVGTTNRD